MARMKMIDGRLAKMNPAEEAAFLASLPPTAGPAVPQEISDRQFAQQLAINGAISEAEALAWAARGDLPEALETAIGVLPEDERFSAKMLLSAATTYHRSHSLVNDLGQALGYQPEQIDDLWRSAALL
jgi:hypothetical protein